MSSDVFPRRREDEIVVQEIDGEVLVYDLKTDKAFCLNETSSVIWNACDGRKNLEEIRADVSRKLDSEVGKDVVWLALQQFSTNSLIEDGSPAVPAEYAGMSRRQLVKKIGLATAVALPIVASLVAPTAAHASSLCMTGNSCNCPIVTAPGSACNPFTNSCANPGVPPGTCMCSANPPGPAGRTCL